MSDVIKKLNELAKEPRFQVECARCKQSVFYQTLNRRGLCLSCTSSASAYLLKTIKKVRK